MTLFKPFSHIKTRIFAHKIYKCAKKRVIYKRKFFCSEKNIFLCTAKNKNVNLFIN